MSASPSVLIVEDDAGIRALLREVLRVQGYEIVECARGDEAFAAADAARPDVILLDIGLPGVDGLAVLDQLKADPELARVPVIMVTAWDQTDMVARALAAGAHDYVRKPFELEEMAARVDAAARAKAREDALQAAAAVDDLTGLANRRALDSELVRLGARSMRSGRPFAVLILDVDDFKAINDQHGHQAGNAVLAAVADRLRTRARAADVVGRWGGEEFMLLAPETDAAGAYTLGEHIREAIAQAPLAGIAATVSVGAAVWADELPAELVGRCDAALYEAKQAGRDSVRVAAAPRPHLRAVA